MSDRLKVTGEIVFEDRDTSIANAVAYVVLEEVGRVDAPSNVITEKVIRGVNNGDKTTFVLDGPMSEGRDRINLRVHISINGDRDVQVGDFITMQNYPVLTQGNPDHVIARVRRVG